jgi:hypothetical protein
MTETVTIEKVQSSHLKIYTDIIINAPIEQVWKVLKDTTSYKNWAIILVNLQGELKNGAQIIAKFQLNPTKEKYNTIAHKIQIEEGKGFYWAEKVSLGICDHHHFKIEKINNATSCFIQSDELTKGASWLLGGYLSKIYAKGYQAFNRALKKEMEQK